jgi:tRNA-dihydrouridine synthase C
MHAYSQSTCPYLFLAPMEGVGDRPFRKAMATIGGFDEACTEFIRVPLKAHIESLAKVYQADELGQIPLAAQIMGQDPDLIAKMGQELQKRGARRIELNCGCPSNTVTGKGAGSSLLKEPNHLYEIGKALVDAVDVPVTIKMRSGYEDTSLFQDNILAAEATGVKFITLHPRTKKDGYIAKANWELIKEAKSLLKIPVVGNGDIKTVKDALSMLEKTGCDALMIGRGAICDPFIFKKIKAHFSNTSYHPEKDQIFSFLCHFNQFLDKATPSRTRGNKIKQILGFIFSSPELLEKRQQMLRLDTSCPQLFLDKAFSLI